MSTLSRMTSLQLSPNSGSLVRSLTGLLSLANFAAALGTAHDETTDRKFLPILDRLAFFCVEHPGEHVALSAHITHDQLSVLVSGPDRDELSGADRRTSTARECVSHSIGSFRIGATQLVEHIQVHSHGLDMREVQDCDGSLHTAYEYLLTIAQHCVSISSPRGWKPAHPLPTSALWILATDPTIFKKSE
jgi:hypothetical protein